MHDYFTLVWHTPWACVDLVVYGSSCFYTLSSSNSACLSRAGRLPPFRCSHLSFRAPALRARACRPTYYSTYLYHVHKSSVHATDPKTPHCMYSQDSRIRTQPKSSRRSLAFCSSCISSRRFTVRVCTYSSHIVVYTGTCWRGCVLPWARIAAMNLHVVEAAYLSARPRRSHWSGTRVCNRHSPCMARSCSLHRRPMTRLLPFPSTMRA